MTILTIDLRAAAECRAAAVAQPGDRPSQRRNGERSDAAPLTRAALSRVEIREETVNGSPVVRFSGYASVTETPYEMYDFFGPYTEVVRRGAFGATLAKGADVAFLLNHKGMTLARTKSGTLRLVEDEQGLRVEADLDPRISDVTNIRYAMERGDLDEMSFAFRIDSGHWSPDYTEYSIDAVDIDRGDVSVVNYGANPHTSAELRSRLTSSALATLTEPELRSAEQAIRQALRGRGLAPTQALESFQELERADRLRSV